MTSDSTSATSDAYAIIVAQPPERDGRFLMVRHRERGWELPGGRMEAREGPVHCALREFREETGHLLGEPKFVMKLQKPNGLCYVFTGTPRAQVSVVDDDEPIDAMEWFDRLPDGLAFPDDPYDEMGSALGLDFNPTA